MTIDFTPSSLGDSPAPRPRLAAGKKPSLTDAQILEMRALADFEGWGPSALSAHYGVSKDVAVGVVNGLTRSALVATRAHLPDPLPAKPPRKKPTKKAASHAA